jgi:CBS domain-containing protein
VKARDLAVPLPTVLAGAPAADAARLIADPSVRAVLLLDDAGVVRGVVSDVDLLRFLIPAYVAEDQQLAAVLDERTSDELWNRLEGHPAADLLREDREGTPEVGADDTLVEVAAAMVRTRSPAVAVREDNRVIGGITLADLLTTLMTT